MITSPDAVVGDADPALIVVTTAALGEHAGCLVGFHSQTSIDPFRYAVWLSKANHTYRLALFATHFAVHFLGRDQHDLAAHFGTQTGDTVDKFAGRGWAVGPGGVPVIDECPAIVFAVHTVLDDGGDHACFVGTPVTVAATDHITPLRLAAVGDLAPGHPADDHADSADAAEFDDIQEAAAGFGHELSLEQIDALEAERPR